jgi:hypothetical protein
MAKKLGLSVEEVDGMLMGLRFASYQDNLAYFGLTGGENKFDKLFNEAIAVWIEEGSVEKTALGKTFKPSNPVALKELYRKPR